MTISNIEELRTERNARLAASDFTMLPDFTDLTGKSEIECLKVYRQELRDLTMSYEEGDAVTWPVKPISLQ
tara:strand:- start:88 stop:300 length:213 start_codon:yes stop_codon:yes gene_type:complete